MNLILLLLAGLVYSVSGKVDMKEMLGDEILDEIRGELQQIDLDGDGSLNLKEFRAFISADEE